MFVFLFCLTSCLFEIWWNIYLFQPWRCVLVWECLYAVCLYPVTLLTELDLKWAQAASFPGVCWQSPPWWEVGLESEGLEPKPGASQDFSCTQWPSLLYHGWSWGLRAGSGDLRQLGFSSIYQTKAVSILVWCMVGAWGLGVATLSWFHFSPCMPWLEAGSWSNGLCTTPLSCSSPLPNVYKAVCFCSGCLCPGVSFTFSGVCIGTCKPVMAVLPWSEAEVGLSRVYSLQVCAF